MQKKIELDLANTTFLVSDSAIGKMSAAATTAREQLELHTGAGNDFHGWLELPFKPDAELRQLKAVARQIRESVDTFISVGIGGSYLGARAAISALVRPLASERSTPRVLFAGQNMSSGYLHDLLTAVDFKNTWVNVISKSGTTTEPGLAFRLLYRKLIEAVGEKEAAIRIIATTDAQKGALRKMADQKGFQTFIIPDDIGGRFSILTPVGLLPIAVAGIDVDALLAGARDMAQLCRKSDFAENPALLYAAVRNILLQQGKDIEILANFDPALHYVGEWWKQLFGESEGKDGKGIFPATVDMSTDLHSMGQLIQDGQRNIFETFVMVKKVAESLSIPKDTDDFDGLNYLAGKDVAYVNEKAYQGTATAHLDGGCPNMTLTLPELNAYYLGQLFYFFEYAVAISGYLLKVNPFNQPGVETYKKNMFTLLGKPGY
ncbi:glucose-6-phosphate isomerase [bacterium]|nr:glucose-6-phosphate isomerase [bacterium]